jgi:hypothetical protein
LFSHGPSDSASKASRTRFRASQYHTPAVPIATYFPCLASCEIGLVPDTLADLGMKGASPVLDTDGMVMIQSFHNTAQDTMQTIVVHAREPVVNVAVELQEVTSELIRKQPRRNMIQSMTLRIYDSGLRPVSTSIL